MDIISQGTFANAFSSVKGFILSKIQFSFAPSDQIYNKSTVMAWHFFGKRPFVQPMLS